MEIKFTETMVVKTGRTVNMMYRVSVDKKNGYPNTVIGFVVSMDAVQALRDHWAKFNMELVAERI